MFALTALFMASLWHSLKYGQTASSMPGTSKACGVRGGPHGWSNASEFDVRKHIEIASRRDTNAPLFSLFFFFLLLFRLRFSFPFFLGGRGGYRYKTPHLTSSPLKEQSIHLKHRCSVVLTATQHALRCRPEDPLCYTDASFSGICCCFF